MSSPSFDGEQRRPTEVRTCRQKKIVKQHCIKIIAGRQHESITVAATPRHQNRTGRNMNLRTFALCFCYLMAQPFVAGFGQAVDCDEPVQAPFGVDGTWNVYQSCLAELQWVDAHAQAGLAEFAGVSGALVSIHSSAENRFVHGLGGSGDHVWIGLTDRVGVAAGAQEGQFAWTSGEPLTFENWRRNQPNNSSGSEDGVHLFRNDSDWSDDESGFAANEPTVDPESKNETRGKRYPSVIEFNTNALEPFQDIAAFHSILPRQFFAGPANEFGNWTLTDYYGEFTAGGPVTSVVQQLLDIQEGKIAAQSTSTQIPTLTVADPDNPGSKSPQLKFDFGNGLFEYPSNDLTSATPDDNHFVSIAHGRIKPQEDGIYTIQVQSSEGFAMRIHGAAVIDVQGSGAADPYGPSTFVHATDTENANTRATFELKADQEYDVEFLTWEREGGAFFEVTSQRGDAINDATLNPQWIALGDSRILPQTERIPTARLTGPLRVVNMNQIEEVDQEIEFARDIILDNLDSPDAESNDATRFLFDDSANGDPAGCPFGQFNHDGSPDVWPNSVGNRDDFASGVFGTFLVDDGDSTLGEIIDVSFHVASDDRSSFRIVGRDFEDVANAELLDLGGDDSIAADRNGCQNSYTGLIRLTEGIEYEFEGIHVERGGDAGMQVLAAVGNHVAAFDATQFTPIQLDPIRLSRNIGLGFGPDRLVGDYNENGQLDAGDLDLQAVGIVNNDPRFDLNSDGVVDTKDRLVWINDLKQSWMGDSNLDGEFNSSDLVDVFIASLFETGTPATWSQGDWDGDGFFSTSDLVTAFQGEGFESGPRDVAMVVAEPRGACTCVLLVSLLLWRKHAANGHQSS